MSNLKKNATIFVIALFFITYICSSHAMERKAPIKAVSLFKAPFDEEGTQQKAVATIKLDPEKNFVADQEGQFSIALFPENFKEVNHLKFFGEERDDMLVKEAKAEALRENRDRIRQEAISDYERNNLSRVQKNPVAAALAFTALGAVSYATINAWLSRK